MKLRTFILILVFAVAAFFVPFLLSPGSIPGNFGDVFLHYYPLKALAAEHIITGQMPLWNPYIFAGQPLLANPQSAVLYPFSLLFSLFPLPLAFTLFYAVHLVLAGLFMYLFLSAHRLPRSAAALGSFTFAFSSFLIYRVTAGHPVILSGFIWLPMILLLARHVRRAPSFRSEMLLAAASVLLFLSGHAVPLYACAIAVFLYWAIHRFYHPASLGRALLFFLAAAAVQLLPTLQLSQVTDTSQWDILTASYSLPLKSLVSLAAPWLFWRPADPSFVPSFFVERYGLYAGLAPLVLAIAGTASAVRRRSFFLPALFLAGLLIAAGTATPFFGIISKAIPGMDFVRVPARFAFLSVFALAAAAAFGSRTLLAGRPAALKTIIAGLILCDLFIWNHRFIYAEPMDGYRKPSPVSAAVSPAYRMITEPARLPADKAMLYHHFNLNGYEAVLLRDYVRYLGLQEKKVLSPTGLARADLSSPPVRGLAAAYRVTPDTIPGAEPSASFGTVRVYPVLNPVPRVFVPRRLTFVPDGNEPEQIEYLKTTPYSPDEESLLQDLPEGFSTVSPASRIYSLQVTSSRLAAEVSLSGPAALVFSEIGYTGWKAAAGGKPVPLVRANKVLRTVLLPAGDFRGNQRVYLYFFPQIFLFGLYITIAALLAATGKMLFQISNRKMHIGKDGRLKRAPASHE